MDVEHWMATILSVQPSRSDRTPPAYPGAHRDAKAIGHKKRFAFDALIKLVIDGAELQIIVENLECDLDELDTELLHAVALGRED